MKKTDNAKRVAVGLSGGVDSAVAAALLKRQGHDVTGVFLECYQGPGCRTNEDRKDALDVALSLDIPFVVLDFKKEYRERVIAYFYSEYEAGRTPNPDVVCNREIKFGMFYEWGMEEGFDAVATGHYARIGKILEITNSKSQISNKSQILNSKPENATLPRFEADLEASLVDIGEEMTADSWGDSASNLVLLRGRDDKKDPRKNFSTSSALPSDSENQRGRQVNFLLRGKDDKKDQSYFLYQLREEQLRHILFPLGEMTKGEVREKAREWELPVAEKADSQGICFVGEVSVTSFLKELGMEEKCGGVFLKVDEIPDRLALDGRQAVEDDRAGLESVPASSSMVEVGMHRGAWFYTVGQRIALQMSVDRFQVSDREQKRFTKHLKQAGLEPSRLPPLYVLEKDVAENRLVVGTREELMRREFEVEEVHWIVDDEEILNQVQDDGELRVRIRHGGELLRAKVESQKLESKSDQPILRVVLEEPVFGVAPGQAAVFYAGAVVVGGGVIR